MTKLSADRDASNIGVRAVVMLLLACASPALGNPQSYYRNEPFDSTAKVLPRPYYGYDPAAFVNGAREQSIREQQARTKGEFETTAQYQQRLSKMNLSNPFATNTYAFGVKPTAVSYDADNQTFTLAFKPEAAEGNANYLWTTLETVVKDTGHHEAQNAFGAVITVQESSVSTYELWLAKAHGLTGCTATAKVAPAEAKSINPDIRALALVRPVPPFESVDKGYSQATFNNPNEAMTSTGRIFGKLVGVRFYDWTTGRTLASCP